MSKETTAYEYLGIILTYDSGTIPNGMITKYGSLVAKEAVKEFAEELIDGMKYLSVMGSVEQFVKHLAKQKGVEI